MSRLDDMNDAVAAMADPGPDGEEAEAREGKKSAAAVLVDLAQQSYTFGIATDGEVFALPKTGPKVVALMRGGRTSLRRQLARDYFELTGKVASQAALGDALNVLEGVAQDQDPQDLHLRVAEHGGAVWIDMGSPTGEAIKVTSSGWTVEDRAPVLFRRSSLTASLPHPAHGGSLDELWDWCNVVPEDRPLILAYLVSTLYPSIPHPALELSGEHGVSKTTTAKVLTLTIDPTAAPIRKPPKDADSWVTAAAGSYIVTIDNLSVVQNWLSDSICRAVTGDGDVRRRLYTDGDLVVFSFRRCIILTGIDLGALNADLAERLLPIRLEPIPADQRLEESELWPRWKEAHPRILGAVLDLAAGVAGVAPSVELVTKPRMADFARVLAAVDQILGTDGLARYVEKQSRMATESLTGDLFVAAIQETLTTTTFEGTSAELLSKIATPERPPKGWPADARAVTHRLHHQAGAMRKAGWLIADDGGKNHAKVLRWTITPPEMAGIPGPLPPQPPQGQASAGTAGMAGVESATSHVNQTELLAEIEAAFVHPDRFSTEPF